VRPVQSPFYPPRARWYSPVIQLGYGLRRWLHLDDIRRALGCSVPMLFAVLLAPGYGFRAAGRARLWPVLAAYVVLALVVLVWLGHSVAGLAFGLMIALHATGTASYLGSLWRLTLRGRIGLVLGVLFFLALLVYRPLRDLALARWIIPLRLHDRVLLVRRSTDARAVKRGDWVVYRIDREWLDPHHYIAAGYALERVLALPGDRVDFASGRFSVNGQAYAALERMPAQGGRVVPEKHWFAWPSHAIDAAGLSPANLAAVWNQMVLVDQARFLGEPCQHWFWRQQTLP
jgi:Signal peptidase, peptidase S26